MKPGIPKKLTADDVKLIRAMHAERKTLAAQMSQLTTRAIADKFGIAPGTVHEITSGYIWRHVL